MPEINFELDSKLKDGELRFRFQDLVKNGTIRATEKTILEFGYTKCLCGKYFQKEGGALCLMCEKSIPKSPKEN